MAFFILYLLMILENVQAYLVAVAIVSCSVAGITVFFRGIAAIDHRNDPTYKIFNKNFKWLIGIGLSTALVANLIPSKQDMAIIAAGGITYNVVTSDKAAELGSKSIELLNKKLETMIDDPVKATKEAKAVVKEVVDDKPVK